ncbi:MAG: DUF4124 domain-containing protein [Pelovirga sp.]
MRTLIFLIVFCSLPVMAMATLYTCRDSEGRLHVTDNLQALPDECRVDAREVDDTDPVNLHFVPEPTSPPVVDTRSRFEQQLREQQRRQQEREDLEEQLIREARELADTFVQAQQDRRSAISSWSADSRATIQQAAKDMAAAREGKQRLLADLERQRVSINVSEQVRTILEQVPIPEE